nr:Sacsin like [Ipomoea batatas]
MFGFLPVATSSYATLNAIRNSIKQKLLEEDIIPCQSYTKQKFFRKPNQVGRLQPAFWNLLNKARMQGVTLHNISSHGRHILNSAFDQEDYNNILNFLDVKHVEDGWYSRCIQSSDLVLGVSEDLYLELLLFVAVNWTQSFSSTNMVKIPLLKYVDSNGHVALCSTNEVSKGNLTLFLCTCSDQVSWLTSWNREFHCIKGYFIAESTQEAFHSYSNKWQNVLNWLCNEVNVNSVDVHEYACLIHKSLSHDKKLVLAYAHFLYHSCQSQYLSRGQIDSLGSNMPLVDDYGQIVTKRKGVVVPANGSKWVQLIGSNPWKSEGYAELGEDYLRSGRYADVSTKKEELLEFLKSYVHAMDIPNLPPPDATLSSMSSPLTRENAFLLLDWIGNMYLYM